jgi:hypothetical protein
VPRVELREQELRVRGDHGEQVVEVVRHPAREPPHGVHLLRVAQLRLEPPRLGDVLHRAHRAHPGARGVADRGRAAVHPAHLAVDEQPELALVFPPLGERRRPRREERGTVVGVHARGPPAAEQLVLGRPPDPAEARVHVRDAAVVAGDEDPHGRRRGQGAEPLLALAQRRLPDPPLRNVGGQHEARVAVVPGQAVREHVDGDQAPVLAPVPVLAGVEPLRARRGVPRDEDGPVLRGADVEHRHRGELVARVAVALHRRVVHREEGERPGVVHPHGEEAALEDHAVARLAVRQRALRADARGHVARDAEHAGHRAGGVAVGGLGGHEGDRPLAIATVSV